MADEQVLIDPDDGMAEECSIMARSLEVRIPSSDDMDFVKAMREVRQERERVDGLLAKELRDFQKRWEDRLRSIAEYWGWVEEG